MRGGERARSRAKGAGSQKPGASRNALPATARLIFIWLLAPGSWLLSCGCQSAVQTGHNTALDAVDLVTMTNDMAMKMRGDPNVEREIQEHGPLKIVVEPVRNQLTAEVLPRGPAEAFTGRVRSLLAKQSPESFVWVMNRDAFYRLLRTGTGF